MEQIKKELVSLLVLIACSVGTSFMLFQCKKSTASPSGNSGSGSPGANEVWIQNMSFNPSKITVAVNTTVSWLNKDGTAHTVTSTSGAFDSGNLNGGATYVHQFTTAGTFTYKCNIHSSMTGTVVVQ